MRLLRFKSWRGRAESVFWRRVEFESQKKYMTDHNKKLSREDKLAVREALITCDAVR